MVLHYLNSIHQTMQSDLDIIQMINFAVDEVEKNYKGLVIGNQGKNFCVGANLAMILMEAQDDNILKSIWLSAISSKR